MVGVALGLTAIHSEFASYWIAPFFAHTHLITFYKSSKTSLEFINGLIEHAILWESALDLMYVNNLLVVIYGWGRSLLTILA